MKNNKHYNPYLQNAWNKYGEENFVFEIIEIVENENILRNREQHYIDIFNSSNRNFGYNISQYAERPSDQRKYIKVYLTYLKNILCNSKISNTCKSFLFSILPYIEYKTNRLVNEKGKRITNKDLLKITGLSDKTLKKVLNELEEKLFIRRIDGTRSREIYVNPYIFGSDNIVDNKILGLFKVEKMK